MSTCSHKVPTIQQEKINLGLAVLLLALYCLYLIFMLRTHPEVFASVASTGMKTSTTVEPAAVHWCVDR